MRIWSVSRSASIATVQLPSAVRSLTFSPDGETVLVTAGNRVFAWRWRQGPGFANAASNTGHPRYNILSVIAQFPGEIRYVQAATPVDDVKERSLFSCSMFMSLCCEALSSKVYESLL